MTTCRAKKINQSGLAQALGISRSYYTRLENGQFPPSVVTVFKLAQLLGISEFTLFETLRPKEVKVETETPCAGSVDCSTQEQDPNQSV